MSCHFRIIKAHLCITFVSILFFTSFSSCGSESKSGGKASHWVMLGSRTIDFVGYTDVIPVSDKGTYSQIRFKIEGRGTTIKAITVTYDDGSTKKIDSLNALMAPGQYSKTIVLPGEPKRIDKVEYVFGQGTGGSGRGMMRLYGYKF